MDQTNQNISKILTIVGQIPIGRVASYGQIARLAGIPKNARQVGRVLKHLPASADVPWHRVVNARGEISDRGTGDSQSRQRFLLKKEGVAFAPNGRISLVQYGWDPENESN